MEREDKTVSGAESMEMKDFGQKNQKDQKVCLLFDIVVFIISDLWD